MKQTNKKLNILNTSCKYITGLLLLLLFLCTFSCSSLQGRKNINVICKEMLSYIKHFQAITYKIDFLRSYVFRSYGNSL